MSSASNRLNHPVTLHRRRNKAVYSSLLKRRVGRLIKSMAKTLEVPQ